MAVVIPDETLYAAHLTATELKQELAVLLFERYTGLLQSNSSSTNFCASLAVSLAKLNNILFV